MPSAHSMFAQAFRLDDRHTRFKLAMSTGFIIATVLVTGALFDRSGHADDLFGSIGALFGIPQTQAIAPQRYGAGDARSTWRHATRRLNRERVEAASYRSTRRSVWHRREEPTRVAVDAPVRLGRQSMCVRLCDGFTFPVGTFHGEADRSSHEATCRSECPGARTALYVLPSGAGSIDDATDVHSGTSYSELPAAFHYSTLIEGSCSCHPAAGNRVASLLRDFTLRRGDAVVTPRGVKVFHGGGHFPFREADFVPLARSRDIERTALKSFHAIERANLGTTVARPAQPTASVPPAKTVGTREQTTEIATR